MGRMSRILRTRSAAFVHDVAMIPAAWFGAYSLRFNFDGIPPEFWSQAWQMLPVMLMVQGGLFWYFGLYRGLWRFASVPDLARILQAVLAGVAAAAIVIFLLTRLEHIPRSVFVLDGFLLVLLLGGPRFVYRWIKDRRLYDSHVKNVLIVGAGHAGEMLVRDLLRDPVHTYRPVGFVDDDRAKQGKEIHGVRVVGTNENLAEVAKDLEVELIMLALPSANSRQMQRIVGFCETTGVPFRSLPGMQDLVTGQVSVKDLREVKIDDLLGRESVSLDWTAITRAVEGQTILVTGGGGSIGSELCRQVARLKPEHLVIF